MTNIITITANQQRAIERSATRFAASADVLRSVYEQYRAPESLELIKNYGAEFAAISAVSKVAPQKVMSNVEASSAAVRVRGAVSVYIGCALKPVFQVSADLGRALSRLNLQIPECAQLVLRIHDARTCARMLDDAVMRRATTRAAR